MELLRLFFIGFLFYWILFGKKEIINYVGVFYIDVFLIGLYVRKIVIFVVVNENVCVYFWRVLEIWFDVMYKF